MASSPSPPSPDPQDSPSIPSSWPAPPLSSHHFETFPVSASSDTVFPLPPMSHQTLPTASPSSLSSSTTTTTTAAASSQYPSLPRDTSRPDSHSHASDVAVPPAPAPPAPPVDETSTSATPTPRSSLHHIKRKPLSNAASTFAARCSQGSRSSAASSTYIDLPKPDHRFERDPSSQDSPTLYEHLENTKLTVVPPE